MGRLRDFVWRSPFFPRKLSFTREGKVVVLVSVGLGVAAVNTGNNLIYLVFSLSLSLILLSGILSEANLRRIGCRPLGFMRVPAREAVPVILTVQSGRKRFAAYSVEAWPWFDSPGVAVEPARFLKVRPGVTASATCRVTFPRRGDYPLRGMVLSTGFPFSFFRKSVVFPVADGRGRDVGGGPSDVTIRVHPRIRDVGPRWANLAPEGEDEHRPVAGHGVEFFGVRDYRPGDSPRRILHRRSASRPTPVVREVEDQGVRAVWVAVLNAVAGDRMAAVEDVEHAIEEAAGLCVAFLRKGFRVGLASASSLVSPGTGTAQGERILDTLAVLPVLIGSRDDLAAATARATPPADGALVVRVTPENVPTSPDDLARKRMRQ